MVYTASSHSRILEAMRAYPDKTTIHITRLVLAAWGKQTNAELISLIGSDHSMSLHIQAPSQFSGTSWSRDKDSIN